MSILVNYVRSDKPDLPNMQMAVLLIVYMTPGPHTARDLALQLRASKSAISRTLSRLSLLGYVQQERDARERRKSIILPTDKGAAFVEDLRTVMGRARVMGSGA